MTRKHIRVPGFNQASADSIKNKKMHTIFYFLQGQHGEDSAHPNAFQVEGSPTLENILECFPLIGTGSFHFRFKTAVEGRGKSSAFFWQDVTDLSSQVPTYRGKWKHSGILTSLI